MKNLHNEVSKHGIPELMFLKRFFKNKTEEREKKRQLIATVSGRVRGQMNAKEFWHGPEEFDFQ